MKPMMTGEYVFGLVNIGKRWGISYGEALRRINAGRIPADRAGHQWVCRASDIDAQRATQPTGRARAAA